MIGNFKYGVLERIWWIDVFLKLYHKLHVDDNTRMMLGLFVTNNHAQLATKHRLIEEGIEKGGLDQISWITLGLINKDEPELAYHAFYIAHLNDHKKVKANSDLQFDLTDEEGKTKSDKSEEERNVDRVLRTL